MAKGKQTTWMGAKLRPLSSQDWKLIADMIGPAANRAKLPDGKSVREGFRKAISFAIKSIAEPSSRRLQAQSTKFFLDVLKASSRMSPDLQKMWCDPEFGDFAGELGSTWKNIDNWLSSTAGEKAADAFLADVVWLLRQCGVYKTLPGNDYIGTAEQFGLIRGARAAVKVAISVAEQYEQAAVDGLRRIIGSDRALVDRLRKALRRGHGASLLWMDCATAGLPLQDRLFRLRHILVDGNGLGNSRSSGS